MNQFARIPMIKAGKASVDVLSSFFFDINNFNNFRELMKMYNYPDCKAEQEKLIKQWDEFLTERNSVGWEGYSKHNLPHIFIKS
ncbi:hypothetical protein VB776_06955 [Arcicella sp. DC2W]|uniref:Uncharacterized protein n=1 Tax=Arcicella gelida TaxID=2984195 RepID=A0ABU5S2G5_9BACT|nr:hypothetical protein [Arcicella sp. DC2W]MEA5402646.1 hypothetical protein [Arcicella sp. DC2W]